MSMISGGSATLLWTSAVFIAGAKAPSHARAMGFILTRTFEEAMGRAKKIVGKNRRILSTPEAFSRGVGVHLHLKAQRPWKLKKPLIFHL